MPLEQSGQPPVTITVVDFDEKTVDDLRDVVAECFRTDQPILVVDINSSGGDTSNMFAMVDIIEAAKESGLIVVTVALGKAYSAAAVLLASGSPGYRFAGANAELMIHSVWSTIAGSKEQVESMVRELNRADSKSFKLLAKYMETTPAEIKKRLKLVPGNDWYMCAKAAKRVKLVDSVGIPFHRVGTSVRHGLT